MTARVGRRWLLTIAAVVAAIAVAVPLSVRYGQRDARLLTRLIAAAPRDHRFVEARLSGFPWARVQPPSRGGAPADPAALRLDGVAGDVLERTQDAASPEAGHARGVALLLVRRAADSIAALEQAARASKDARAWSDLAAARYALAVQAKRPSQLPEALANADRALRLDPRSAEAHFNRALILEQLNLRDGARKAWRRYLEIDPGSEWSVEARARLERLGENARPFDPRLFDTMAPDALAQQFPEETRRRAETMLLAQWAKAALAQDEAAAAALLARARALGDALQRRNGEQLLRDAVAAIDRAGAATRAVLADGHRVYDAGRRDHAQFRFGEAERQFRAAAQLFDRGGSPMAAVARQYAAMAAFSQGRGDEAHAELVHLLATNDATRHRALRADLLRQLAVGANAAGDWGTGARHADASAAIFRDLGESSNAAVLDGIAAMSLELIGERDLAWTRRLRMFAAPGNAANLDTILRSSAYTLATLRHEDAAASLLDVRIDGSADAKPEALAFAHADAFRLAERGGDPQRAERALVAARANAARVADPALRKAIDARIDLAGAWRAADPRAAVAALDRGIAFFEETGRRVFLPDAYLQRARAHRKLNDDEAAAADYDRGLREVEQQSSTIPDTGRLQFLDVAAQLIEETIDLRLDRGDAAGAFAIADRARALLAMTPLDASPANVRPALPPRVALVEYAVLAESVVAFCVTNDSVTAHRTPISRADLETRIASFVSRIRRRAPLADVHADAEALHRLLIAPVSPRLAGVDEIVVIPDRQLHAVPFAALRNPATGKYLLEELTIRFAPSAAFRRESTAALEPALVVVDPPTPDWPPLLASREEGTRIAAMHRATLLAGKAATRAAFFEAAPRSSLIHFAGHANSDAGTSYGALLLAANGRDTGVAGSSEIARLRLDRQPLVILAACGTFRGDALHVSGMASLSRAFLTAGARGVAGTLWEIDDDVSAPLFLRLHQYLRAGDPPAQALRRAQTDLLRSGDPWLASPASWAALEFLGGV